MYIYICIYIYVYIYIYIYIYGTRYFCVPFDKITNYYRD